MRSVTVLRALLGARRERDAPTFALSFRNLYASKAPLPKLIDWDADIFFSEGPPGLLAPL